MGHHYLPQFYLQGFTKEGLIWVHDRVEGKSFRTQPKVVANENGMYGDEMESYLANHVETPTMAALEKVRNLIKINENERIALAKYIITLWKRVPKARKRTAEQMPRISASVIAEIRRDFDHYISDHPGEEARVEERFREVEEIIEKYQGLQSKQIWQMGLRPKLTPRAIEGLLSMRWRYLVTEDDFFLTSDNPVFFFEDEGIGRPQSELSIPISSNVAIWANRNPLPELDIINLKSQGLKELNRRTASNATRYLFSKENQQWILPFHQQGSWHLNHLL